MRHQSTGLRVCLGICLMLFAWSGTGLAQTPMKPFILAWKGAGVLTDKAAEVEAALKAGGFEIAGRYSPYGTAIVIAVTNPLLKATAAKSRHGGYGAVMRVALTQVGNELQVAYSNPPYLAAAYRLAGPLTEVAAGLKNALGDQGEFGPQAGLTAKELAKYHYMFGMEYFDEPSELAKFPSHAQAVQAVEKGLAAKRGGTSQVYRVDIPGKEEVVFGVALTDECSGDQYIMSRIDFKPLRSTAHLPYEILVSGKTAYALYARFRIAINFPDLSMMGDNSFFSIMCAPDEIEEALEKALAGGLTGKAIYFFHVPTFRGDKIPVQDKR